ncbi:GYD domain-containing protein [Nocardia sp. NPDC057663]|uniref:GYD domain-containing protein n=1 Tax=Nocardia sp. NPDC057663 TaxID=3346201 RepID=UPI00366D0694
MPKYMWRVSYLQEGAHGLLAQGGSARQAAITEMVESVGGQVEACYFAFGEDDLFVIGDVPDDVSAAALAIRTAAAGAAVSHTVGLLTPAQIDEAVALDVTYRPPA